MAKKIISKVHHHLWFTFFCIFHYFISTSTSLDDEWSISSKISNVDEVHGSFLPNTRRKTTSSVLVADVPLFVFGDSLYDPGNNNYINTTADFRANFLPYGQTHFEFATGRFSDGRLIPDFIAKYAGLPLIPPYFQSSYHQFGYGVNFASGGGGALAETHRGLAIDLKTQLVYFRDVEKQLRKRIGDKETQKLLSNAVYMFSIGGNDLIDPNPIFSSFSSQEYIQIIIGNFTSVLKEVYKAGGRKFGFVRVMPVGCMPYIRVHSGGEGGQNGSELCLEKFTILVNQYNDALSEAIHQLEKQLKGFIYSKFDLYNAVLERIQNPSKYGFKNVKSGCCGSGIDRATYTCGGKRGEQEYELCDDPGDHFFFESYHPSEKAYKQFSKLMWDGPLSVTGPYTLKALFQLGNSVSAHSTPDPYSMSDIPEFCEGEI